MLLKVINIEKKTIFTLLLIFFFFHKLYAEDTDILPRQSLKNSCQSYQVALSLSHADKSNIFSLNPEDPSFRDNLQNIEIGFYETVKLLQRKNQEGILQGGPEWFGHRVIALDRYTSRQFALNKKVLGSVQEAEEFIENHFRNAKDIKNCSNLKCHLNNDTPFIMVSFSSINFRKFKSGHIISIVDAKRNEDNHLILKIIDSDMKGNLGTYTCLPRSKKIIGRLTWIHYYKITLRDINKIHIEWITTSSQSTYNSFVKKELIAYKQWIRSLEQNSTTQ